MIEIFRTNSNNSDFKILTGHLDKELTTTYGEVQNTYNKHNKIDVIETVVLAYFNNKPVGCGCFKTFDKDSIEVKRMFVLDEYRGKGFSKMILNELEKWATEKGFKNSYLETGIKQYAAKSLYKKSGYSVINNYGPYVNMENSVCMRKILKS